MCVGRYALTMESWSGVNVPSLSAYGLDYGPPLHIFDVTEQDVVEIDPSDTARMYVCGITPYDATHLGHAATYIAFDLVQRVWRDRGIEVTYTQNVTDIDDPLLERAKHTGVDWQELAHSQTDVFTKDMHELRVVPPDHFIGAVETIDLVIAMIQNLRDKGAIYAVGEDLYFRVRKDPQFGTVSRNDDEAMLALFAERGGDPERAGKADPLDCLVWKAEVPGEPAWDGPLGRGRPGWHIECAAIALTYLGANFDIQGGGHDLSFPHHEMSASQGRIATGEAFAKTFVHGAMVAFDGDKMSKSKGNLEIVSRLRADGVDPMAIRLAILAHHYRHDWEWCGTTLSEANDRRGRWELAVNRSTAAPALPVVRAIRDAMSNDLDTPSAIRAVDNWAVGDGDDPEAPAILRAAIDALLGVRV